MNTISATLTACVTFEGISQLSFDACGTHLTMVGLEPPTGIERGSQVLLGVKGTHIALSMSDPTSVAIANVLPIRIESIEMGRILSVVTFRFAEYPMEAIVPSQSLHNQRFEKNQRCYALFGASELALVEILS